MIAQDIIHRFEYRPVTRSSAVSIQKVHALYLEFARELSQVCPEGRELALALTRLEESLGWADKAIPRE